ncbi:hypothetical protein DL98DRAFT_517705 [Cadophora sp. DSE1049]|nr:hypothetical protein DL98DRAFT_517705 [Cadophora sp. DSE1049]
MRAVYDQAMELEQQNRGAWLDMPFHINTSSYEAATFPLVEMVAFLKPSWWSRIWVVQDIAAATNVEFLCGHQRVDELEMYMALRLFFSMQDLCGEKSPFERSEYENRVAGLQDNSIRSLLVEELPCVRSGVDKVLPTLFEQLSQWYMTDPDSTTVMKATESRDFVFSLLGICSDVEAFGIEADYIKSCPEVSLDTAAAIIISSGNMDILSLAQHTAESSDIPSWVADWSRPIGFTLQRGTHDFATSLPDDFCPAGGKPTIQDLRPYAASKTLKPPAHVFRRTRNLTTLGVSLLKLDSVVRTLGSPPRTLARLVSAQALFRFWGNFYTAIERMSECRSKYHELEEAFCRCLILDRERVGCGFMWTLCRARQQSLSAVQEALKLWRESYAGEPPMEFWDAVTKDEQFGRFSRTAHILTAHKQAFITEQGWIGMGPKSMLPGDLVAIILGADVPFILRVDDQGHHRIVGEAYVQGAMDGEAVELGLPVVDIDLY